MAAFRSGNISVARSRSAVFLTERQGREPQRAAIKLILSIRRIPRTSLPSGNLRPSCRILICCGYSKPEAANLTVLCCSMWLWSTRKKIWGRFCRNGHSPRRKRASFLEPALDALAFIHSKSLVHGRLKPSNIMATQDQLKLSSDSMRSTGDSATGARPSVYDAPEIASGRISPASDSWSLGMTLMEALTQRLPARDGMTEPVPETVPAPFMGIAHCCLRRDPERRCTAGDIAARLRSNAASPLSFAISQGPSTLRIPAAAAKWRYILPIAAVALIGTALLFGPKLFNSEPASQPASSVSVSSEQAGSSTKPSAGSSSQQLKTPARVESSASTTANKPSVRQSRAKSSFQQD